MPTLKPGKVRHQLVLDKDSEICIDLHEWARKRGLTPAQANRVILADWSDALRGKPNPFAMARSATLLQNGQHPLPEPEPEESPEERARREAALEAAKQFM